MNLLDDTAYASERALERESVQGGAQRYWHLAERAIARGDGASLKPVERLMLYLHEMTSAALNEEACAVRNGTPGRDRTVYGPYMLLLPTADMAVIALHETLSLILMQPVGAKVSDIAFAIGNAVCAEFHVRELHKDPETRKKIERKLHRAHSVNAARRAAKELYDSELWSHATRAKLGSAMFECLRRKCVLPRADGSAVAMFETFEQVAATRRRRTYHVAIMCREALDLIREGHNARQFLRPRYSPMIAPPVAWGVGQRGGYLEHSMPAIRGALLTGASEPPQRVMDGINAVNATAWRVNKRVLAVVEALWESGGNIAGIVRRSPKPIPPKDDARVNDAVYMDKWRREARTIHRYNENQLPAEQFVFASMLDRAKRFADTPRLWFPHTLDFRGRAYPVPLFLNHQGNDICRGLLEFADPQPVTERARHWIKVQLANCCDMDKCSIEDRVAWVDGNMDKFRGWVRDPIANTGWATQDSPCQALAAAYALLDEGAGAHLPVQADGTNNALQHYAAMLRCEQTGAKVNLVPGKSPSDVYAEAGALVNALIETDVRAESADPFAVAAEGWVNRKVVKQPTMTTVYGVTMIGRRKQVENALNDAEYDNSRNDIYPVSKYIANGVRDAVEELCAAAVEAMNWLTECASRITATGQAVAWTSPCGIDVVQPYKKSRAMRLNTIVHKLRVGRKSNKTNKKRQVSAFAPNFVHAIDASHMFATAIRLRSEGIDFAGVHDSYWCHAAHRDRMNTVLREEFISMHATPLLDDLVEQLRRRYPTVVFTDPPALGNLNLSGVADSEYFFS